MPSAQPTRKCSEKKKSMLAVFSMDFLFPFSVSAFRR